MGLRFILLVFSACFFFVFAQLLPTDEQTAIRREMIEKDIAIRNIASLIALGETKDLAKQFSILSEYQMVSHPQLKEVFQKVLTKWKKRGLDRYFESLQKKSKSLKEILQGEKNSNFWSKLSEGYLAILSDCRGCHKELAVVVQDE